MNKRSSNRKSQKPEALNAPPPAQIHYYYSPPGIAPHQSTAVAAPVASNQLRRAQKQYKALPLPSSPLRIELTDENPLVEFEKLVITKNPIKHAKIQRIF